MKPIILFLIVFLFVQPLFSQTTTGVLTFTHDGLHTTQYVLVVDGAPGVVVTATPVPNQTMRLSVPLPALTVGITHAITIAACNGPTICSTSAVFNLSVPISPSQLSVTITITIP